MRRRTLLSSSIGLAGLTGLACSFDSTRPSPALHTGAALAFGTTVAIKVIHENASHAAQAIQKALHEVKKIDALMSPYQPQSQLFQLNETGALRSPDRHFVEVLKFARQLSVLSAGAFDITVQALWKVFSEAKSRGQLPDPQHVQAARALVNWQGLEITEQQLRLARPGMAITLNGLAQGYALDLATAVLQAEGIQHALLDTGEFGAIGHKQHQKAWALGIADPRKPDNILTRLQMDERKLATSGDYECAFDASFFHHHIFDPASGLSPTELASVAVLAPTGILADGLSTAFMVMGSTKALASSQKFKDVDALLVRKDGSVFKTANFPAAI
ncbi:MAG: FAD:protein FMN transferase [Pseudomonadota bacterium]